MEGYNRTIINSLTGMRFIAILLIVVSHLEFLKNDFYWRYLHNATIGVDFFFILSGFGLMLSNIKRNAYPLTDKNDLKSCFVFAINHVKKIYPIYISTIIAGIPLYIYQEISSGNTILKIVEAGILKLAACAVLIQSLFGLQSFNHAFNGVCWFLSCLFCIYIISPFLINLIRKICTNLISIIACLLACPVVLSVIVYLFKQIEKASPFDVLVYCSPYVRVFYVIFGMLIALLLGKCRSNFKLSHANLYEIAVFLISICYFLFRKEVSYALPIKSTICAIDITVVGLIVFILALNQGIISGILSKPKLVYWGELSKYIFLIHYPVRLYLIELNKILKLDNLLFNTIMIFIIFVSTYYISKYLHKKQTLNNLLN